jgi:hypothetical protein
MAWIALLTAWIAFAYLMNSAFHASTTMAAPVQAIKATPTCTPDLGPSCTWIGAYCAFPDH